MDWYEGKEEEEEEESCISLLSPSPWYLTRTFVRSPPACVSSPHFPLAGRERGEGSKAGAIDKRLRIPVAGGAGNFTNLPALQGNLPACVMVTKRRKVKAEEKWTSFSVVFPSQLNEQSLHEK